MPECTRFPLYTFSIKVGKFSSTSRYTSYCFSVAMKLSAKDFVVALIAKEPVGTLTELAGGWTEKGGMQGIDLGEQQHILTGIAAREWPGRPRAAIGDPAGGSELAMSRIICPREHPVTLHRQLLSKPLSALPRRA